MRIIFRLTCLLALLGILSSCASTLHEDKEAPCSPAASAGKSPCEFIPVNVAALVAFATTA